MVFLILQKISLERRGSHFFFFLRFFTTLYRIMEWSSYVVVLGELTY